VTARRWPAAALDTIGAVLGAALIATDPDAWRFLCADVAGALLGVALAALVGVVTSGRPGVQTSAWWRPTSGVCVRARTHARDGRGETGGAR
jgi:hypothetical protein